MKKVKITIRSDAGGDRGHRGRPGTLHVAGGMRCRGIIGVEDLAGARWFGDVSTVHDHRLERFERRKCGKRARRKCDLPRGMA